MKKTLAERLKEARIKSKLSQIKLGKAVGISQAAVQKIETGKAKNSTKIVEMAKVLNVRPEWLSSGDGPMMSNYITSHNSSSSIPPESEWMQVSPWDSKTPLDDDEVEVPFLKDIELAGGSGCLNDDDHNGFKLRFSKATLRRINANTDGSSILCFPVHGDSMEPVLPEGTTVGIDLNNKKIVDGEIYAINQDGLKRIKVLYRRPMGKILIRSFNRIEYEDEMAEEAGIEIIGRVFWYSVIRY